MSRASTTPEFVFWQRIVSPHIAGLARALVGRGAAVTYFAERLISAERAGAGWPVPDAAGVRVRLLDQCRASDALVDEFPDDAVHLTQGLWRNGYVRQVVAALGKRGKRWGALFETVDDRGVMGAAKRVAYSLRFAQAGLRPDFVLAIGARTRDWVVARGFRGDRAFPFAYFLESPESPDAGSPVHGRAAPFRIGFVGRMVRCKRLDVLVEAFPVEQDAELVVVGGGPLEERWRRMAEARLSGARLRWLGPLRMAAAQAELGNFDCLVLPSDHDGWGAVVSEALLSGVPAICSDACGASDVVRASAVGGVFRAGDVEGLRRLLHAAIRRGSPDGRQRAALASWAGCLAGGAGARYLDQIVASVYGPHPRPVPPWASTETADREPPSACAGSEGES